MTKFADLKALIGRMTSDEKISFDKQMRRELNGIFLPNPGAQSQALTSRADILLYGGAAGGGKTALLVGAAAEHQRAMIFRREAGQLDGVRDFARELYADHVRYNGQDDEFSFADRDCRVRLGGMRERDDWRKFAGRARDFLGFDEGGEFLEEQVGSIIAWNRSADPNQRLRVIIASNPPRGAEGQWLIKWFEPWLNPAFSNPGLPGELRWAIMVAGETRWVDGPETVTIQGEEYIPLSRTFVPALLKDNPFNDTTQYRARLNSLPEPLRSQLLYGDFLAGKEDHEFQVIPSAWVAEAQARWNKDGGRLKMLSLGVDVAQGGGDTTCLAALHGVWFAPIVSRAGVETPDGPSVAALVVQVMRDGCAVRIDCSGGWGGSARDHLQSMGKRVDAIIFGSGSNELTRDGTRGFYNLRAELYWRLREALDPAGGDKIALPPDPRLAAELTAAIWTLKRDRILIESKADIRKRLGFSPDRADALVLAWHNRKQALFMQKHGSKLDKEWAYADDQWDPFAGYNNTQHPASHPSTPLSHVSKRSLEDAADNSEAPLTSAAAGALRSGGTSIAGYARPGPARPVGRSTNTLADLFTGPDSVARICGVHRQVAQSSGMDALRRQMLQLGIESRAQ